MPDGSSTVRLPGEHSPYWIHYPLDIRQQLRLLAQRGERVLLWFGPNESIVSSVLEVGADGQLLLDIGPDRRTNDRLLQLSELWLTGFMDGVEIQAPIGPLRPATHAGLPAFACPAPQRLHRLQRREFHRMPIPAGHKIRCTLPTPDQPPRTVAVELLDISLGGLCLVDPGIPGLVLHNGVTVPQCNIVLEGLGSFTVDLEVRHVESHPSRSGQVRHRVGCRFVQLPAGAQHLVQRCITQLELDRRALSA
ncbi:flagellar brake protein [Macromonas nakdongensis]|uniref:flagellar brake protein n=1 Tax=Macromonas nakdongensis TaxID=1843082 RepID=UPI000C32A183|nr:flagellar brake protein [Macromonas nakdongensis]